MTAYTATTALPYPHRERAAAGLRAALRLQLLEAGVKDSPDWSAMEITGPEEFSDDRGHTWFGYWARVAPLGGSEAQSGNE